MDVRWEEPPAPDSTMGRLDPDELVLVQELRDHPGDWVRFKDYDGTNAYNRAAVLASNIKTGKRAAFRKTDLTGGHFVAVVRRPKDEVGDIRAVYVKYVTKTEKETK